MAVTGVDAAIYEALVYDAGRMAAALIPAFDPTEGGDVAFPDVTFRPKVGKPYLAVTHLPNTADRIGLSFASGVNRQGLVQVSVMWPSGQGRVKPMQVAAQIAAWFAPGKSIARNGVVVLFEQEPQIAPAVPDLPWINVPVTARYRVDDR